MHSDDQVPGHLKRGRRGNLPPIGIPRPECSSTLQPARSLDCRLHNNYPTLPVVCRKSDLATICFLHPVLSHDPSDFLPTSPCRKWSQSWPSPRHEEVSREHQEEERQYGTELHLSQDLLRLIASAQVLSEMAAPLYHKVTRRKLSSCAKW